MDEGYKNMTAGAAPAKTGTRFAIPVAIAIVFGGLGFFGGVVYQKSATGSTSAASASNAMGGAMMGGQAQNGGFGTVSAISDTSITIADQRQGDTKTYSISTSTTIMNGTASGTVADIAEGDRVMVQTDSSTSTVATSITVNPTMPSGGPSGQAQSGAGSTTVTGAVTN